MHSLALTLIATLSALFAFSAAIPLPQSDDVSNLVGEVLPVAGDVTDAVPVDDISNLVTDTVGNTLNLRATPRAIAIIITEAQSQVAPLTQKISFATAQNCSSDDLSPIAAELQSILSGAATEIKNLAGQPLDIVLGAVNGVGQITVPELAQLIDGLLTDVIGALGVLEITLGPKIQTLISGVLCDVIQTTADLLCNIKTLVSDLLAQLVPIIGSLIPTILNLNLSSVIAALGLPI